MNVGARVCVHEPELVQVSADVKALVIPKLHQHQTPTKGCLHDLTLDKCLRWLFIQLYQFSDRSLSLSFYLSGLSLAGSLLLSLRPA